ncbi:MAG: SUMF1/EgtB/PvdO family nonheme iron enzyme [Myxococcales bacterium]|nr:formylglycine-generating enzyme family protein [Polyangiaceae bacterium]MDW8248336.1 SUMF1/EgtB/PvdO family nonheme iron enzyme [Myxococcales bacterium]
MLDPDLWAILPWALALTPLPTFLNSGFSWALASLAGLVAVASLPPACPPDMALVDGFFCPDLPYTCARDAEHSYRCAEYARDARCRAPVQHRRYCIDFHEWPNRIGEVPEVYVDWFEAKAKCAGVGKRLCSRVEWVFACEGEKRLPYAWGYVRQPSPCNIDRAGLDFDIDALLDPKARPEELARLWQGDPIGSHPNCRSSWGVFDLNGNVDEWTDDQADNPSSHHISTLNGAYWGKVRATCRITTTSHGPTFKFYQVGFRCCADPRDGIILPDPPVTILPRMTTPN